MTYIHGTNARIAIETTKAALRAQACRKITDTELAEMLNVRPLAVYRWKNGSRQIGGATMVALVAIERHPEDYIERERKD